jgi:UDP-GlcNAc:undecaprenyl-phosphate/decaprenyl-phosphate GlcNAc-1-phosphate transferase
MREYVLTLLAAAAVTYLLTPLVRRFAAGVGAMHAARDRDVHVVPTPLLGGFAMYAGLAAGLLVASQLPTLNSAFAETNMAKGLLLAGGLVVVMGFVDDRWGMGALSKLAGQVAAGVILVWSGAEVTWLPAPGGVTLGLTSDQQTAVTILVVVMTINAVNFIDGLDGLAAGIVGIGAVAFFIYYYTLTHRLGLPDQTGPALASAVLAGVCLGFLPHNFYPARIFMGDTGSMLLGLLLAYAPISSLASLDPGSLTDYASSSGTVNRYGAILPLLLPAAVLLIPYADLLMAVVRRVRAGMSVFAPDKKHLQHRLLDIGHSHRTSVLIMYLWAALFAGSVVWLSIVRTPLFVLAIVTVGAMLALLLVSMPRLRPWARQPVALNPVLAGAPAGADPAGAVEEAPAEVQAPPAAGLAPAGLPAPGLASGGPPPVGVPTEGHAAGVPTEGHAAGVRTEGHPAGVPTEGHPAGGASHPASPPRPEPIPWRGAPHPMARPASPVPPSTGPVPPSGPVPPPALGRPWAHPSLSPDPGAAGPIPPARAPDTSSDPLGGDFAAAPGDARRPPSAPADVWSHAAGDAGRGPGVLPGGARSAGSSRDVWRRDQPGVSGEAQRGDPARAAGDARPLEPEPGEAPAGARRGEPAAAPGDARRRDPASFDVWRRQQAEPSGDARRREHAEASDVWRRDPAGASPSRAAWPSQDRDPAGPWTPAAEDRGAAGAAPRRAAWPSQDRDPAGPWTPAAEDRGAAGAAPRRVGWPSQDRDPAGPWTPAAEDRGAADAAPRRVGWPSQDRDPAGPWTPAAEDRGAAGAAQRRAGWPPEEREPAGGEDARPFWAPPGPADPEAAEARPFWVTPRPPSQPPPTSSLPPGRARR